jgi:hypothetical protein
VGLTKIKALKGLEAKLADSSVYYQWSEAFACNCGLLAQVVNNVTDNELADVAWISGPWEDILNDYDNPSLGDVVCPVTGLTWRKVVESLWNLGFTDSEIKGLEMLNQRSILERLKTKGHENLTRNHRGHVLLYVQTWIELEEEAVIEVALRQLWLSKSEPGLPVF